MPTYEHICQSLECGHEWEDQYSIKLDPPKVCPKCLQETAKRLVSGGGGRGIVELGGQELVAKIKQDAKALQKDAANSDKIYANLLGEDRYQSMQTRMDHRKNNR